MFFRARHFSKEDALCFGRCARRDNVVEDDL